MATTAGLAGLDDRDRELARHAAPPTRAEMMRAVLRGTGFEWTRAGRLRHPRYQGLREDKDAADVVRER